MTTRDSKLSTSGAPLTLEVLPLHPRLRAGEVQTSHVLVRIRASAPDAARARPRLSAVLALDVSGSMQGEPLAQVQLAAEKLVDILEPGDRLGVVGFAATAQQVAPLAALGPEARREAKQRIRRLTAGGGTNIEGALAQAALAFPKREAGERQVVVLMSDGQPNVGASTPGALGDQAKLVRDREVTTCTLGFGAHHSDDVLVAIAERGGGRYAFVVDAKLAEATFARTLGAQLDVVADDVHLVLTPREGVEIARVLDDPATAFTAEGLRVSLQDLVAGDELNVGVELRVKVPRETGPFALLGVSLRGRHAGKAETFAVDGAATVASSEIGPFEPEREPAVAVALSRAADLRRKARVLGERGSNAEAIALVRQAVALLEAVPGFARGDGSALDDACEALADDLVILERAPSQEEYQTYTRAARDYGEFQQSGASVRSAGTPAVGTAAAMIKLAKKGIALPKASLVVITHESGEQRVAIDREQITIGRAKSCDVTVKDPAISRQHAIVEAMSDGYYMVDLGSTSGVELDATGERVTRHKLKPGDVLRVGGARVRYEED